MIRQMKSEKAFEKIINKNNSFSKEQVAKIHAMLTSLAYLDYKHKKETYGKH